MPANEPWPGSSTYTRSGTVTSCHHADHCLDISTEPTAILKFLLKARFTRLVVVASALAAMLALPVLPPGHLHASDDGRALVHRHSISLDSAHGDATFGHGHATVDPIDATVDHDDAILDHGEHSSAATVAASFDLQRSYHPDRPLTSPAVVLIPPEDRLAASMERVSTPPTHGPPIRIRSLRAPPA